MKTDQYVICPRWARGEWHRHPWPLILMQTTYFLRGFSASHSKVYFEEQWDADTSNKHGEDAEYFLIACVGGDVAKANTGEARASEVESRDVGLCMRHILDRYLELLGQGVGPACDTTECNKAPR